MRSHAGAVAAGISVLALGLALFGAALRDPDPDLAAARYQTALSLGWHVIVACLGVGFPLLILLAEGRALWTGDPVALALARSWSKALAVLFAVGAVSGTILSFELGMLWPGFMGRFGPVIGLPFALEGFAFFIEAIFVGIHLYGWDRLSPRAHWWCGVPIVVSGLASAAFVVTANAWMNQPEGFRLEGGRPVDIDPWKAMANAASPPQVTHMLLAALMVAGFLVAGVHARALLRGQGDAARHRLGFVLAFGLAAAATPLQVAAGDWAARFVAGSQPAKFAALEGVFETRAHAPFHLGGIPVDGRIRGSLEIPGLLSWLAHGDPAAEVTGLDRFAPEDRPPGLLPHLAFQTMILAGGALAALAAWFLVLCLRRRAARAGRTFLRAACAGGPLAILAMEGGWIATEVGRQPWVVQGILRTSEAATTASGIRWSLLGLSVVLAALTTATLWCLDRLRTPAGAQPPGRGRAIPRDGSGVP